jgi:hypothetical protein
VAHWRMSNLQFSPICGPFCILNCLGAWFSSQLLLFTAQFPRLCPDCSGRRHLRCSTLLPCPRGEKHPVKAPNKPDWNWNRGNGWNWCPPPETSTFNGTHIMNLGIFWVFFLSKTKWNQLKKFQYVSVKKITTWWFNIAMKNHHF